MSQRLTGERVNVCSSVLRFRFVPFASCDLFSVLVAYLCSLALCVCVAHFNSHPFVFNLMCSWVSQQNDEWETNEFSLETCLALFRTLNHTYESKFMYINMYLHFNLPLSLYTTLYPML